MFVLLYFSYYFLLFIFVRSSKTRKATYVCFVLQKKSSEKNNRPA